MFLEDDVQYDNILDTGRDETFTKYDTCGSVMVFDGLDGIGKVVGNIQVVDHPTLGLSIERFVGDTEFLDYVSRYAPGSYTHFSIRTKSSFNN